MTIASFQSKNENTAISTGKYFPSLMAKTAVGVLKSRLKTLSIALTRVCHAVMWPNSDVAGPRPSTFADPYTLIEQSNTLLKQSTRTIYGLCPINLLSLTMALYTIVQHKK